MEIEDMVSNRKIISTIFGVLLVALFFTSFGITGEAARETSRTSPGILQAITAPTNAPTLLEEYPEEEEIYPPPTQQFGSSTLWAALGMDIYNTNTGNVGIGTSKPRAKLDVRGDVSISGVLGAQKKVEVGGKLDVSGRGKFRSGVQFVSGSTQPPCNANNHGMLWLESTSQSDKLELCMKVGVNPGVTVQQSSLSTGKYGMSCVTDTSTNLIYCFGGTNLVGTFYDHIVEYDYVSDTLSSKNAVLPSGRYGLSCAEDSSTNLIYCFGGNIGGVGSNQIMEYNPSTDTLIIKSATLTLPLSGMSCAEDSSTNLIYCFGGGTNSPVTYISSYNPQTDTLTLLASSLPFARWGLSCVEDSSTHKIYCFGGEDGSTPTNEIVEFNPLTGSVIVKSTLPKPNGPACVENSATNLIYCFGGYFSGTYLNEILEYDPSSSSIQTLPLSLPTGLTGLSCASEHNLNSIYCFGGSNPSVTSQIIEYATATSSSYSWTKII